MQQGSAMRSVGGRAASRERRAQLVRGKGGLPPATERTRNDERETNILAANVTLTAAPRPMPPAVAGGPAPASSGSGRITGTLFSGDALDAACGGACNRVTGDTPVNVSRVTGTQRGANRDITGTSYYRAGAEGDNMKTNGLENAAKAFTVRSPQLTAQLAAADATGQPSAEGRITGTFARGEGKITGNQEFHFRPRPKSEGGGGRTHLTGEGRVEGPKITGGAWDIKSNITGTEDYIAAERNPSERAGRPHAFANAGLFKGKGKHETPTQHVTGMVGWSAKTAARVTLSGGALG